MTRDELLDWAQTTGRIAPGASVREAWANAYDLDPAGTTARLQATPSENALAPTGKYADAAREWFGSPSDH